MKGLHSPFGIIWQIATATGWTVRQIMWSMSWPAIQMMIADAPSYRSERKGKVKMIESEQEQNSFFGIK
ncbi:MAG: hypothetical protein HC819_14825 [Cyclobacteriaceae bacterium]|nr:hypothetical protein [Cyclobacteriaceae bacterium]